MSAEGELNPSEASILSRTNPKARDQVLELYRAGKAACGVCGTEMAGPKGIGTCESCLFMASKVTFPMGPPKDLPPRRVRRGGNKRQATRARRLFHG